MMVALRQDYNVISSVIVVLYDWDIIIVIVDI